MLHTMVMGLACDCNKHINNFSVFTLHSWWGSTNTSPGISNCRQRRLESIHLSNISSFHQGVPSILTFSVSLLKGFIYLHHLQTACVCGGVYWQKCNCIYCSNQIHNILNACRYVTRNMFQLARCVCVCVTSQLPDRQVRAGEACEYVRMFVRLACDVTVATHRIDKIEHGD